MLNQVVLAKRAEALGFSTLWFRDVPLRDPNFGDVGQVFDPWVYLGYIAAHTSEIALGTASIAIPLHHPLHTAKASASIDQLSAGRLILGVASGDRPVEFSAFGVDPERRGEIFREHYEVIRRAHSTSFEPIRWSGGEMRDADLIPKPTTQVIPMLVTGNSRQSLDWIARESTGWINYPRPPNMQRLIVDNTDSFRWIYVPVNDAQQQGHEIRNTLSLLRKEITWNGSHGRTTPSNKDRRVPSKTLQGLTRMPTNDV
jgi:luciferase-type oxidoreductase